MPSLAILVSAVLVLSCGHTESQNYRQTESHSQADQRYTHATTVGVSKEDKVTLSSLLTPTTKSLDHVC